MMQFVKKHGEGNWESAAADHSAAEKLIRSAARVSWRKIKNKN
jgi:hypothetical protein